jgi:hypothetical protein
MNLSGTITSDFMKLAEVPTWKKPTLINFAATDFLTLRNSLIAYAKAVYPDDYQYFVESDLGMMFLELVAYMGSVMSMKADMLANENFLATAKQRTSVKKLLNLIGVKMRGPLSAATQGKLLFENNLVGLTAVITPDKRIINTISTEDGGAVTYTLYKVVNGLVDTINSNGNIYLNSTETDNALTLANVFTNIVLQEGALVQETGEFAATEGVKSIKLSQGPVVDGSVQVYVTDPTKTLAQGAYTEVQNIYFASGSSDRIFEVLYDDNYNATILFGDNSTGIVPSENASYLVQYRVGGGTRGNIPKSYINTKVSVDLIGTQNGSNQGTQVATLTNISKGTGGSNAETIEHAKRYAPLTFRRQDRLVTLEDYSVFANTFISNYGTVGKATAATRRAYASANVIDIYVLEKASDLQLQRATTNFKTQLLSAMNKKKMATDDVVIVDGLIRTLDLITTIKIDKDQEENQNNIKAKVRNKILNYMNVDNREFGQALDLSELNRQIFEIDEVRYSTIDNLGQDVIIDFNEIIQLNNLTINIELLD